MIDEIKFNMTYQYTESIYRNVNIYKTSLQVPLVTNNNFILSAIGNMKFSKKVSA